MRAVLAWIFTLTAGLAAFLAIATITLLPWQAAKNRAVYSVVDRYAHRLAATNAFPRKAEEDDPSTAIMDGVHVWPSLPGGCWGAGPRASSDRLELGFWDDSTKGAWGSSWWYCYTYPSGKTNLQLSVTDYLVTAAGWQVATYVAVAIVAFCLSLWMRSYAGFRNLRPWTKAIWFGAFVTVVTIFDFLQDKGDDQFYENTDYIKWFVFTFEKTIGLLAEALIGSLITLTSYFRPIGPLQDLIGFTGYFGFLVLLGWLAGRLVSFAKRRFQKNMRVGAFRKA